MTPQEYRRFLIAGILEMQTTEGWTEEQLRTRSTRALEIIYDNVGLND